jgi:hypothetical protein
MRDYHTRQSLRSALISTSPASRLFVAITRPSLIYLLTHICSATSKVKKLLPRRTIQKKRDVGIAAEW